jgi:hypothetical protein
VPADVVTTGSNVRTGETPPVMPIEATKHTAEGAKAFATFYVRVIDWGEATVSASYMRHYTSVECSSCGPFLEGFASDHSAGHRRVGGRITVRSSRLSPKPLQHDADYTALVVFDVSAFQEFSRSGKVLESDARHLEEQFEVSIGWFARMWQAVDLRISR